MYEALRKWWKPILVSGALLAASNVAGMPSSGERRGDAPRASVTRSDAPRPPSMPSYHAPPQRVEAPRQHYQPAAPLRSESRPAPSRAEEPRRAEAPRSEPRYQPAPQRAEPPRADAPRHEPQYHPTSPRDAPPRDARPRGGPRDGPRDRDPNQGPDHDGYRPPRAESNRPRDHRPPVFIPARPRGDYHPRPGHRPPHVRPYWDWRHHAHWGAPFFGTYGWWGSWCWDAPYAYRTFATPLSVVESFAIPPPPGYDSADVSYFKNGADRTIRVELTRERRNGLEFTVLRDDNAGCDERPFVPCREFSRLDQAVVINALDRQDAVRNYWQNEQGNFRKTPGLFEAIYDGMIYPEVRDRLVAQRLW